MSLLKTKSVNYEVTCDPCIMDSKTRGNCWAIFRHWLNNRRH